MIKKYVLYAVTLSALALVGCGSSGDGGTSGSGGGTSSGTTAPAVAGPIDPVQNAISSAVIAPLSNATAGTPLQGVLTFADKGINGNLLDIVDSVANGVQNPTTLASTTPAQVQAQTQALVNNLVDLLGSLGGMSSGTASLAGLLGSDPLAGTPLAPLSSALLPVLSSIQSQLTGAQTSGVPLDLGTLSGLFTQLQNALTSALGQLPPSVTDAPILGGLLTTLQGSLGNVGTLLNTAASNPAQAPAAVASTLQVILNGLTTQIVPLGSLQGASGLTGSGLPLSTVTSAISSLTSQVQSVLSGAGGGSLTDLLGSGGTPSSQVVNALAPVLALVQPLSNGLSGISGAAGGTGNPVSDLLNTTLPSVTTLLNSLLGLGGGLGGTSGCALQQLPLLGVLCPIIPIP